MSTLSERFDEELKSAMKGGDKVRVSTLRMVKASVKNTEIDRGHPLEDGEVIDLLMTLCKQRKESIAQFEKGGRQDLADQETQELGVLQSFLPEPLSPEEIEAKVRETISEVGASGPKDMGAVMKAIKPRIAGRADGKLVSDIVKKVLG
ncbi:MAG: GatB/YqeY domain-containing protein [Nitrospirota bacterium]|nr:GatB/YqeY domain-containing protein [Nitrospirota bacterium]